MFIIGLVGRVSVFISLAIYFYFLRLLNYPLFRSFSSSTLCLFVLCVCELDIFAVSVGNPFMCGFRSRFLKKFNEHSIRYHQTLPGFQQFAFCIYVHIKQLIIAQFFPRVYPFITTLPYIIVLLCLLSLFAHSECILYSFSIFI